MENKKKMPKWKAVAIAAAVLIAFGTIGQCTGGGQKAAPTENENAPAASEQKTDETPAWDADGALAGRTIESAWDIAEENGYAPTFYMSTNNKDAFPTESRHTSTAQTWRIGEVEDVNAEKKTVTCIVYNPDQFIEKYGESAKVD